MSCDCNTLVVGQAGPQGPQGLPGINGTIGANGINAFSTLTASFVQPAAGATVTFFLQETAWAAVGQALYIAQAGTYSVLSISPSPVNSILATLLSTDGVAVGATVSAGRRVTPTAIATVSGSLPSLTIATGGVSNLDGPVTINTSGNNSDFRVEGVSLEHLLYCQANGGGSGRVGVGVASPSSLLHVGGTFQVGTAGGSSNASAFFGPLAVSEGLTVDSNTLVVDASTNRVGIGTTPSVALDVVGDSRISGGLAVDSNTLVVDAANNRVGVGTAAPTIPFEVVGTTAILGATTITGTTAIVGSLNVDSGIIFVDATNNRVGINTTTPAVSFNVFGTTAIVGTTTITGTTAITGATTITGTTAIVGSLDVDSGVISVDATNNRVGINKTTPAVPFDVVGTTAILGSTTITGTTAIVGATTITGTTAIVGAATVSAGLTVDASTLVVDATNNRVGINKTTPAVPFDVVGTTAILGSTTITGTTAITGTLSASGLASFPGGISFSGGLADGLIVNTSGGAVTKLFVQNDGTGRVGINTSTSLNEQFTVSGTSRFTGVANFSGGISLPSGFTEGLIVNTSGGAVTKLFVQNDGTGRVGINTSTSLVENFTVSGSSRFTGVANFPGGMAITGSTAMSGAFTEGLNVRASGQPATRFFVEETTFGRVGINTSTSLVEQFTVNGTSRFTGVANFPGGMAITGSTAMSGSFTEGIQVRASGQPHARIFVENDNVGRVGINTSTSLVENFTVNGTSKFTGATNLAGGVTFGGGILNGIFVGSNNSATNPRLFVENDATGRVGINTSTSLTDQFTVKGDSTFFGNVKINSGGALVREIASVLSASYSIQPDDCFLDLSAAVNTTFSLTFPTPSSAITGRSIHLRTRQGALINSASNNIRDMTGNDTTVILPAVTAGTFDVGSTYTILTVGTTSFTSIGAVSNTVGVSFVATGVGSGSGTATQGGRFALLVCDSVAARWQIMATNY